MTGGLGISLPARPRIASRISPAPALCFPLAWPGHTAASLGTLAWAAASIRDGPGMFPRLRVVGDAGERATQLDGGRQFALFGKHAEPAWRDETSPARERRSQACYLTK